MEYDTSNMRILSKRISVDLECKTRDTMYSYEGTMISEKRYHKLLKVLNRNCKLTTLSSSHYSFFELQRSVDETSRHYIKGVKK